MEMGKTCFFSGHRSVTESFAFEQRICEEIKNMYDKGVRVFLSGGALGFDTICGEQVIYLRRSYMYDIQLKLYLPCWNYNERWSPAMRMRSEQLQREADETIFVTNADYAPGCMKARNYAMVDDAAYGIVYWDSTRYRSGTGQTVRYAQKKNRTIVNIF